MERYPGHMCVVFRVWEVDEMLRFLGSVIFGLDLYALFELSF